MSLTNEQIAIIATTPDTDRPLVVTAFAGTGKTFTLERYAEARPRDRMLYAAFNKAIQLDAERKMPGNVMCRTTHSLAYRQFGYQYRDASLLQANVPVWRLARYLGANIIVANFAFSVVKNFLSSADPEITERHIPQNVIEYYAADNGPTPPLVDMASGIWDSMKSLGPKSLPMVHDGYLKLYQLSRPVLNFDYVMLDEAQDTTPCVWDIISNQRARKIVVGDKHQAIYSWRGAENSMDKVGLCDQFYLTQSFRFGPDVAKLATTLLSRFKGEQKELKGLEDLGTEVTTGKPDEKRTVLARGNALIFRSSAHECEFTKRTLGYVGGDHTNYRFQTYTDVYNLFTHRPDKIKDPVIKSFDDYEAMKEYSEKIKNNELQGACTIIEEYKRRIPGIMQRVAQRDVGAQYADLSYATGHKAKGLEFPVVQIANDFDTAIDFYREETIAGVVPEEELNLLYVAITRGTDKLYIPESVKSWIETGSNEPRSEVEVAIFVRKQKVLLEQKRAEKKKQEAALRGARAMTKFITDGTGKMDSESTPKRVQDFWGRS